MTDRHPNCVLTEEQVRYVRRSLASASSLAKELGVSLSTIQRVRKTRPVR